MHVTVGMIFCHTFAALSVLAEGLQVVHQKLMMHEFLEDFMPVDIPKL